jgi:hypothetical protein
MVFVRQYLNVNGSFFHFIEIIRLEGLGQERALLSGSGWKNKD